MCNPIIKWKQRNNHNLHHFIQNPPEVETSSIPVVLIDNKSAKTLKTFFEKKKWLNKSLKLFPITVNPAKEAALKIEKISLSVNKEEQEEVGIKFSSWMAIPIEVSSLLTQLSEQSIHKESSSSIPWLSELTALLPTYSHLYFIRCFPIILTMTLIMIIRTLLFQ